jgi:hypothetical protein
MRAVITRLIEHYGLEVSGSSAESWVTHWLETYESSWVRLAAIEALYQGRYKTVSIDWILKCWGRRGHPTFHFGPEFERLICRRLPRDLRAPSPELAEDVKAFVTPSLPSESGSAEAAQPASADRAPAAGQPATAGASHAAASARELSQSPTGGDRSQPPIHQFSPSPDRSRFYAKLKAVAARGQSRS